MSTPSYKSGTAVTFSVAPTSGTPSAATVTVKDEAGVTLDTITPDLEADAVTFVVPGDVNTLTSGVVRTVRSVETSITTEDGTFLTTDYYLVEANAILAVLANSFVSYGEALMTRAEFPSLPGWDAASEAARTAALQLAYTSLTKFRFKYKVGTASQSRIADFGVIEESDRLYVLVSDISETTSEEWALYSDEFKTALKRAQITEADSLLRGDPVGDKRRAGIVSEKIGEVSMYFRQVPEVSLPVCREALTHLRGFVVHGARIARGS